MRSWKGWIIGVAVVLGLGAGLFAWQFLTFGAALRKGHRQVYLGDAAQILLNRRAARGELPLAGSLRFDPVVSTGPGRDERWSVLAEAARVGEGKTFRYILFEGEAGEGRSFVLFDKDFVKVDSGAL